MTLKMKKDTDGENSGDDAVEDDGLASFQLRINLNFVKANKKLKQKSSNFSESLL